jgi:hypothetical protein
MSGKILGTVLTQVDLHQLRRYDRYLRSIGNKRYVDSHHSAMTGEAAE